MSGKKKTCPVNWRAVAESYIEAIDKRLAESATVEIVTGPDVDREHMDDGTVDTVGVSATVRVRFPLPAVPDGLVLHAEDLHPAGDGWTSPAWEGVLDSLDDLPQKIEALIVDRLYEADPWGEVLTFRFSVLDDGVYIHGATPFGVLIFDVEGTP